MNYIREWCTQNNLIEYLEYFLKEKIYLYTYIYNAYFFDTPKIFDNKLHIVKDMIKKFKNVLDFVNTLPNKNSILKFLSLYYKKLYLDISCDMKENPDKSIIFEEIIGQCDNLIAEDNSFKNAIHLLKGDIHHDWGMNTVFGVLHYEACLNEYDYVVCQKLSSYCENIIQSTKKAKYSLQEAYKHNNNAYKTMVNLGYYFEKSNNIEVAICIYERIIKEIDTNKELSFDDFYEICQAHRRLCIILYQNEDNPQYVEAINHCRKIFEIWNSCEENSFLNLFDKKYRNEIVSFYKLSFHIRGSIASLAKIYCLTGEKEKERICNHLFIDKWENLQKIDINI